MYLKVNWNAKLFFDKLWTWTSRVKIKGFRQPMTCRFCVISLQPWKHSRAWHVSFRILSYPSSPSRLLRLTYHVSSVNESRKQTFTRVISVVIDYIFHPGKRKFLKMVICSAYNCTSKGKALLTLAEKSKLRRKKVTTWSGKHLGHRVAQNFVKNISSPVVSKMTPKWWH